MLIIIKIILTYNFRQFIVDESMNNKDEQLNLRISADLKSKLSEISDKKGISMSDFIRQNLENVVISKDKIEQSISALEEKFITDQGKLLKRMMYAAANIASIDTGHPLDQCLSITIQTAEKVGIQKFDFLKMSRDEMETQYLEIQERIKKQLQLSDPAIAFISDLISSLMRILYNEHFFDVSPLSIITLESVRKVLQSRNPDRKQITSDY